MFFRKPLAKRYPMTLTKLKIAAAAPDHPLPHHTRKSWPLAEEIHSQNALLVCSIGFN